jgi:hypothetical protein
VKKLLLLTAMLWSTNAFAEMPPADMDLGNEAMSEQEVIDLYRNTFPNFGQLSLIRVPFGKARRTCLAIDSGPWTSMPEYGCQIGDTIVYSYDTRLLAWSQGRNFDSTMANHVLRHEFAHRFYGWTNKHERARP